jgi:small subunit ribosomal protein S4
MARYRGPRLRVIRRIGDNIPGLMCIDQKNIEKQYPPGEHGKTRKSKQSDYHLHLTEKQKLRYHYGVLEKQLRRYTKIAFRNQGNTGFTLLSILEKRLDNIMYRSGLFRSMKAARQAVAHNHVIINNKKVNIPSFLVRVNDIIEFRNNSIFKSKLFPISKSAHAVPVPEYIQIDNDKKNIRILSNPIRKDIPININEQLVVEYYSGR